MPRSLAVALGAVLGLPAATLGELDLNLPIVGALVDSPEGVSPEFAVHVKDGTLFIGLLTQTESGFSQRSAGDGVTILAPKDEQANHLALGISGNYLLLGLRSGSLVTSGPFLTRTLPTRAIPAEDMVVAVPHDALSGAVTTYLTRLWQSWKREREAEDLAMRDKHGGSAPDFGDPAEALADIDARAAKFFAFLGDLTGLRATLQLTNDDAHLFVTATPASPAGMAAHEIATMPVADASPLLALPSRASLALMMRDTSALRELSSKGQVEAIAKILGGRLDAPGRAAIDAAFAHWAKGRGDWLSAGVLWTATTQAAVVRAAVTDPNELSSGALGMLRLLSVPAIAGPVANWIGEMKWSSPSPVAAPGGAQIVHMVRRPPKLDPQRDRDTPRKNDGFDIVWSIDNELLCGAAGVGAKGAHAALRRGGDETLGSRPEVATAIRALGNSVSFALRADPRELPLGIPSSAGSRHHAMLLAYGKDDVGSGPRAWLSFSFAPDLFGKYVVTTSR